MAGMHGYVSLVSGANHGWNAWLCKSGKRSEQQTYDVRSFHTLACPYGRVSMSGVDEALASRYITCGSYLSCGSLPHDPVLWK
jgi:hypothetical protein